jgi:hypothetical protein
MSKFEIKLAVGLACGGAAVPIILYLVPPRSPLLALISLIALFLVLLYPVAFCWSENHPRLRIAAIITLAVAVVAFGLSIWPSPETAARPAVIEMLIQLAARCVAYARDLPWLWIMASFGMGALVTAALFLLREKRRKHLLCPDKQIHQTRIDDKSAIKELVKVCMVKCDTSIIENGPPPYIDFDFRILSLSLHRVSIKSVDGYITFQKDATGNSIELIGTPRLQQESHAENLAFRATDGWVRIRQPLDLNQAPWVKSGLDHSVFYFHHLNIMVEGDGFEPVRLDVDKVQKRIPYWAQDECGFLYATVAESEAKIRTVEAERDALKELVGKQPQRHCRKVRKRNELYDSYFSRRGLFQYGLLHFGQTRGSFS